MNKHNLAMRQVHLKHHRFRLRLQYLNLLSPDDYQQQALLLYGQRLKIEQKQSNCLYIVSTNRFQLNLTLILSRHSFDIVRHS